MGSSNNNQTTYIVIGLVALASAAALYFTLSSSSNSAANSDGSGEIKKTSSKSSTKDDITPQKSNAPPSAASTSTASTKSSSGPDDDDKALHRRIEDIDRAGKALFKEKRYMEAAETFTEALDLIAKRPKSKASSSLIRQVITLTNNRSAMYEKEGSPILALSDCDAVLDLDPSHIKARTRRLRILEAQKRYPEALVEVCALQLSYMNDNRDKLRLGLPPTGTPPVAQSKIEELVTLIQPDELAHAQKENSLHTKDRPLPCTYTITQLLKSFSGYNKWMGEAAKGGKCDKFTSQMQDLLDVPRINLVAHADYVATKASFLLNRGKRYAYENNFERAVEDFEAAFILVDDVDYSDSVDHEEMKKEVLKVMDESEYARLLEWMGMCNHLRYNLKEALECYERCSELEPENAEILVKRAGVKMDGSKHSEAEKLFDVALNLNPTASDALLHRANLRMLQQRINDSQTDLEQCIRLYPNNLLARLRLVTVLLAKEDMDGAKRLLDQAEEYDPDSSEVHCYRGEIRFTKGEFELARSDFEKASECDPYNPTPYMNASLAIMNTPPAAGQIPDIAGAIKLLEKSIERDPMLYTAYVQLGQMKLSMATDLAKAKEVVDLYDKGLKYCRTSEELKDICCMRILTLAQIDAAHALKMETLNMQ